MQKAMANALGVVNIGGIFVVLLCGLAFAVLVTNQLGLTFTELYYHCFCCTSRVFHWKIDCLTPLIRRQQVNLEHSSNSVPENKNLG